MKRIILIALSAMLAIGFAYASLAIGQNKSNRTVSEIHFHSKWISHPVEYSKLKVRGKSAKFSSMFEEGNEKLKKPLKKDEEFDEADDFWEHISFDATNVWDKTIVFLRTGVYFYTKEGLMNESFQAAVTIDFGNPNNFTAPFKQSLEPGQSKTFAVSDGQLEYARQKIQQLPSPVVRVGVYAMNIYFADGSNWGFDGKIFPPKPNKSINNSSHSTGHKVSNHIASSVLQAETGISGNIIKTSMKTEAKNTSCRPSSSGMAAITFYANNSTAPLSLAKPVTIKGAVLDFPCPLDCYTKTGTGQFNCEEGNSDCKGTRDEWMSGASHTDPNSYVIMQGPPVPCKKASGVDCGYGSENCVVAQRCPKRPDDEPSDYCGSGASCNPTGSQLAGCNGSWDCSSCDCLWGSPILIDVQGNGFSLTNPVNGVVFDIKGMGVKQRWAWTTAQTDDAWLALDRNGNGQIDSGTELFGNYTAQPPPPAGEEKQGFLALAVYDLAENGGNRDGKIDRTDTIFSQLRLWQDTNHNGVSESNELHPLVALGVETVDLKYQQRGWMDEHGNLFKYRAKVRDAQGANVGRWAYDVFLLKQR